MAPVYLQSARLPWMEHSSRFVRPAGNVVIITAYFVLSLMPLVAASCPYILWTRATALLGHTPVVMVNDPKQMGYDDPVYQAAYFVVWLSFLLVPAGVPVWLSTTLALYGRRMPPELRWLAWFVYVCGWLVIGFIIKNNPSRVMDWIID